MLQLLVVLLAAAVLCVSLSRALGFGSVLGYLVAGAIIGPSGFRLVDDVDQIAEISELGVVMLLFLIGLEVRPQRLWVMRRAVFGLGLAQVVVTGAALAGLAHLGGVAWSGAIVLGLGLALSSTAIVLPLLGERTLLGAPSAAMGSRCCCSRISSSFRWWRCCRCSAAGRRRRSGWWVMCLGWTWRRRWGRWW